jgi:membrane fusion protein (multidrug efflux system)
VTGNRLLQLIGQIWPVARVLLGLILLAALIAWLSGMFEPKVSGELQQVAQRQLDGQSTEVVHEVEKEYVEEVVGELRAANRSVISSRVLAPILAVHVNAGDLVDDEAVLIELERSALEARVLQAEESLLAARATRSEAESSYNRVTRLFQNGSISKEDLDLSQRNVSVAQAEERRAAQVVTEAQVQVSYATIRAPRKGRVINRLAEPGDTAQPGVPLLVLYEAETLRLEAPVKEELAVQLVVGQQVTVHIDAINRDVQATIDEIVPEVDTPSRSFLVKANLVDSDRLYEGMFGRLMIPIGSRKHVCLPTDAIQRLGQLEFVDVVREDKTLERRMIRTGRLGMPGRVEVLSGLEPGETVTLQPHAN